ncbi:alcohol dehydrogenase catalytic domain-containing protein [Nonomuraea glycinis]|uniref:alcohol dehydrogenase catalytic domain-containing protein n=1 Tax=Nonomuraea glycinis TaxID=2047744 RepID=UPI002E0EA20B|nr:zinc-binding dehydrogenase [Nonomuraea glycinis]
MMDMKMKAGVVRRFGGPDVVEIDDVPRPVVGDGDVLVRLRAAGLNRADVTVREGRFAEQQPLPIILGVEGAGDVVEVGSAVTTLRPGQRVVLLPMLVCGSCAACRSGLDSRCPALKFLGEHTDGTYAEYIAVPARNAIPAPESLGYAELAASILAYLTAWHMLVTRGRLQPEETVLVVGAGSGVGSAAVQLAGVLGARVIATTGTDDKRDRLLRLGAHEVVNYRQVPEFSDAVRTLTEGRGADLVHDSVGGATIQQSIHALRHGGRLIGMGSHSGPHADIVLYSLYRNEIDFRGAHAADSRELAEVLPMLADGRLRPIVDSEFTLDDAPAAQERLVSPDRFGKVVLTIE